MRGPRLAFVALLALTSCQKRVDVAPPVVRPTYQYVRLDDGRYLITAQSDAAAKDAMKAIGCVCGVQETRVWILTPNN